MNFTIFFFAVLATLVSLSWAVPISPAERSVNGTSLFNLTTQEYTPYCPPGATSSACEFMVEWGNAFVVGWVFDKSCNQIAYAPNLLFSNEITLAGGNMPPIVIDQDFMETVGNVKFSQGGHTYSIENPETTSPWCQCLYLNDWDPSSFLTFCDCNFSCEYLL